MISYLSLFFSALVAATINPMKSEAVFVGLLATTKQPAGCCQTNDCKHQIEGAIKIYALNN